MAKMHIVFEDVTRADGTPGVEIALLRVDDGTAETVATELSGSMMITIEALVKQLRADCEDL